MTTYGEPWRIEERTNSDYEKYDQIIDATGGDVTGAGTCGGDCYDCGAYPCNSHEPRIVACVNALAGIPSPAGIPGLIAAVTKILQACHEAKAHGWEDHTNFTQTLETALEGCYKEHEDKSDV